MLRFSEKKELKGQNYDPYEDVDYDHEEKYKEASKNKMPEDVKERFKPKGKKKKDKDEDEPKGGQLAKGGPGSYSSGEKELSNLPGGKKRQWRE